MNIFHLCVLGVDGYRHLDCSRTNLVGGVAIDKEVLKSKIRNLIVQVESVKDISKKRWLNDQLLKLLSEIDHATPSQLQNILERAVVYKNQISSANQPQNITIQNFGIEDEDDDKGDDQDAIQDFMKKQKEILKRQAEEENRKRKEQQELTNAQFQEQERKREEQELKDQESKRQQDLVEQQALLRRLEAEAEKAMIPKYGKFVIVSAPTSFENLFEQLIQQMGPILQEFYLNRRPINIQTGQPSETYQTVIDQFTPQELIGDLVEPNLRKSTLLNRKIDQEIENQLWINIGEEVINQLNTTLIQENQVWDRKFGLRRKNSVFTIEYKFIKPFAPFFLQIPVLPEQNPRTRQVEMSEQERVSLAQQELVSKLERFLVDKIQLLVDLNQNGEVVLLVIPHTDLERFVLQPSPKKGPIRLAIYHSFIKKAGIYWNNFIPMVDQMTQRINQDPRLANFGRFIIYVNNNIDLTNKQKEINLRIVFKFN